MGLLHVFHVIFICPLLLLVRGLGSPFIVIGQLLRSLLFYNRTRRRNSIVDDDGTTTATPGSSLSSYSPSIDNLQHIGGPQATDGCLNDRDNLKYRYRHTLSSSPKGFSQNDDVLRGGGLLDHCRMQPSSLVPKDLPQPPTFYAINVPHRALEGAESPQLVFQEKGLVLKELKKFKGARFKSFPTEEEAINYTNYVPEPVCTPIKSAFQNEDSAGNSPHPAQMEKSTWKAPKGPELLKLRKSIEAGDYQGVVEMINSNPRFLISCGDTPSILHEGPRYNALHFAAKNNQPDIIRLWIQTIEDPHFFMKLYGLSQENEDARNVRVQKLLDLYLNTPDKGPCETPLHFACKFGHTECVEVLMSHPLTEPNPKNKFGETPADLICQRVDKPSKQSIFEIKEYLEGRRYVPLYRAEDNIVSPTVGTPCSPIFRADVFSPPFAFSQMKSFSPEILTASPKSPHDHPSLVKAFAGPMSPSKAEQFRKLWRSPCSRNEQANVVKEDHEKGYERLGRDLALQNNVPWSEYWEFLDRFTDLSKPEGIELLESHLQKQSLALNVQRSLEAMQQSANNTSSPRLGSASSRLQSMKKALFSDGGDFENGPDDTHDRSFDSSLGSTSLPPPPPPPTNFMAQSKKPSWSQVEEMDVCPPIENGTTMPFNQDVSPERKELSFREENLDEIMNTLANDFGTKLYIMSPESPPDNGPKEFQNAQGVNSKMNYLFSLKSEFSDMLNAVQNQEPLSVSFVTQASCDKLTASPICPSPDMYASASPQSSTTTGTVLLKITSPNKLVAQMNGMPAKSPPALRNPLKIFIQGSVPTKLDRDVQRCLNNVPIDSKKFPYTARWLQLLDTFSEMEQKSWSSPAKAHGKESKEGTPVMKARGVRRLEPMTLFKSPSTAI